MIKVRDTILKIWSITWLIAFIFTVIDVQRNKPRFKFSYIWREFSTYTKDQKIRYKFIVFWTFKNQSQIANSLNNIHQVIWFDKNVNAYLDHSINMCKIYLWDTNTELELPLRFEGHEAKKLKIISDFIIDWSFRVSLLTEKEDIGWYNIAKHEYELLFEDINENIFSEDWKLCNIEEAWLRFELPNTIENLKNWKPKTFIAHYSKIMISKIKFWFKKIAWSLWIVK
jgi:methyltransferase-like protein